MNTLWRRCVLALLVISGLFVGLWAIAAPRSFYDTFPSLGFHWIDLFGPYNVHLVFDVGALQAALAAGSLVAVLSRTAALGRLLLPVPARIEATTPEPQVTEMAR